MSENKNTKKSIFLILFIVYIIVLCYILLFWGEYRTGELPEDFIRINLKPFVEITRVIYRWDKLGPMYLLRNVIGNILVFLPFGMLLPCLIKKNGKCRKCVLAGFLFSFFIEICQLAGRIGIFDIDDLILNTLGTLAGYFIYKFLYRIIKEKKSHESEQESEVFSNK